MNDLTRLSTFIVRQKYELAEHFGFETRNKYQVLDEQNREVLFVAEQQKGLLGILLRQFIGHWRSYTLHFFDEKREKVAEAHHPFRLFFRRIDVRDAHGQIIGSLQQRWGFFRRRFDVLDAHGRLQMEVRTGIAFIRIWRYPFKKDGREVAAVDKKWTGLLKEMFTDSDNFVVTISDPSFGIRERLLLIAAAIFIDLTYFEKKAD